MSLGRTLLNASAKTLLEVKASQVALATCGAFARHPRGGCHSREMGGLHRGRRPNWLSLGMGALTGGAPGLSCPAETGVT